MVDLDEVTTEAVAATGALGVAGLALTQTARAQESQTLESRVNEIELLLQEAGIGPPTGFIDQLQDDIEANRTDIADLQQNLDSLQNRLSTTETRVNQFDSRIDQNDTQLENHSNRITDLENTTDTLETDAAQLNQRLNSIVGNLSETFVLNGELFIQIGRTMEAFPPGKVPPKRPPGVWKQIGRQFIEIGERLRTTL